MRLGKIGLERERGLVAGQRLGGALEAPEHGAAVVEGVRHVGLEAERPVVARQRLREAFQALQHIGATVPCQDHARIDCKGTIVARQRLTEAPEGHQGIPAVVVGVGKIGLEDDRPVVARQRLRGAFEIHQHIAAVVEHAGVVGLGGECLVVARERLVRMARSCQHDAVVRQGGDGGRLQFQCRGDTIERFGIPALLEPQDPEQMQRIEMVRLRRENRRVMRLGLVQPALLMAIRCARWKRHLRLLVRILRGLFHGIKSGNASLFNCVAKASVASGQSAGETRREARGADSAAAWISLAPDPRYARRRKPRRRS